MILTGARGNVEIRARSESWPGWKFGGNASPPPPGWSGGVVDRDDAASVPAAFRAVAIAAEAVASMQTGVWRGSGLARKNAPRSWQSVFFGAQPNDDEPWSSVWMQTEASVTAEGNGYWWLTYDSAMRISAVQVVDPELVVPRRDKTGRKVFDVRKQSGNVTVDQSQILHFRGTGNPGDVKAPNPVDVFADALGAAVARMRYETGFYENGMGQGLALIYPSDMTAGQAKEYRDALGPVQGGVANKVRVFGGGPTIQGIGISPRDAQFIEAMNFSVEDVARIYGVPASIMDLGGAKSAGMPLTPEHEMTRWLRFGLEPRLRRIEAAINHHPAFFGATDLVFAFQTDGVLRGDLATEDAIAHQQIQDGRLLVDEWRIEQGKDPLPDGVGMIPQIVPVGGAPNPLMPTTPPTPPATTETQQASRPALAETRDAALDELRDELRRLAIELRGSKRAHQAPPINVSVDNPAAVVNVELDVAPLAEAVERSLEAVEALARRSDDQSRESERRMVAADERFARALEQIGQADPNDALEVAALERLAAATERIAAAEEAEDDSEQLAALDRIAAAVLDVAAAERAEDSPLDRRITFKRDSYGDIIGADVVEG